MSEAFAWPEGTFWYWTGTAGSAQVAYGENLSLSLVYGWSNYRTMDSAYHNTLTGQRADVQAGAVWSTNALQKIFDAKTAVHLHFVASGTVNGTAGLYLWSGVIDTLDYQGQQKDVYRQSMSYHCNEWSAY